MRKVSWVILMKKVKKVDDVVHKTLVQLHGLCYVMHCRDSAQSVPLVEFFHGIDQLCQCAVLL